MEAEILGVHFEITCENDALLDYTRSFVRVYDDGISDNSTQCIVKILIERSKCLPVLSGDKVAIHRSKHKYWTFDGIMTPDRPPKILWETKGLLVSIGSPLVITISQEITCAFAGESIFHVIRSLALYKRASGNFIHASAVEVNQRALLFIGSVLSGKTTLFTELVLRHNAIPISNDRVLIKPDSPITVISWPSYASYCEGTLLGYPELAIAAEKYEDDNNLLRTQTWIHPLKPLYSPEFKRIYPMKWFTDVCGRKYIKASFLGAIIFSRVAPEIDYPKWRRIDFDDSSWGAACHLIQEQCFDNNEPSFAPWHGLSLPSNAPSVSELLTRIKKEDCKIFELSVPVNNWAWVPDFLGNVTR